MPPPPPPPPPALIVTTFSRFRRVVGRLECRHPPSSPGNHTYHDLAIGCRMMAVANVMQANCGQFWIWAEWENDALGNACSPAMMAYFTKRIVSAPLLFNRHIRCSIHASRRFANGDKATPWLDGWRLVFLPTDLWVIIPAFHPNLGSGCHSNLWTRGGHPSAFACWHARGLPWCNRADLGVAPVVNISDKTGFSRGIYPRRPFLHVGFMKMAGNSCINSRSMLI